MRSNKGMKRKDKKKERSFEQGVRKEKATNKLLGKLIEAEKKEGKEERINKCRIRKERKSKRKETKP